MGIKCLHISDMHLDSPFKNITTHYPDLMEQMKSATEKSVQSLVQKAIDEQVDIVLIVGDSFNSTKPNVRTQFFLKEQLEKLLAHHIHVVLCYGNHDYMGHQPLVNLPKDVYVLSSEVTQITLHTHSGEIVDIYGFSYDTNHVTERKITRYPIHQNMTHYAIGMLHGYLEGSQSKEGVYAPFSIQELNDKHYDYWALGHIHKRMLLQEQPPIIYSGNVQGLNRHETGEKGAVLVSLNKGKPTQIEWVNTSKIQWNKIDYTISKTHHFEQIITDISCIFETWESDKTYLVSITWHVHADVSPEILELLNTREMKESLNKKHVYVIKEENVLQDNSQKIMLNDDVLNVWEDIRERGVDESIYDEAMQSVFSQTKMRTLLPSLRSDEGLAETIIKRAINRLALALYKGGEE
ncbi:MULTISPECIES: DNA repair exonuclease [unclassified Granulicatella]|uniref:metallophosphoesterase family protein n=1 Tax=unclassified Granulicatella TaxID=2630493 RepID=UPI0010731AB3|nr:MULTISPECIES: DNA repair exonuclease [unclassified Granulicatella]MBF0779906.1 DNA repair exonuclease [Granulicatella sp. 19428wC4_WM01]TFU96017.1 DNA repair exonuclease [Granulicatella sp. WM01]